MHDALSLLAAILLVVLRRQRDGQLLFCLRFPASLWGQRSPANALGCLQVPDMHAVAIGHQSPEAIAVALLAPPVGDGGVARIDSCPGREERGEPEEEHERGVYPPAVAD